MTKNTQSRRPTGRWKVLRSLGESGQAYLHLVVDEQGEHLGKYVCKVLKNDSDAIRRKRFQIEIKVTNSFAEAGLPVVPVVDFAFPEKGRPYFVTPFFPRGDLHVFAADNKFKDDLRSTLDFIESLVGIVKQIHQITAHRDLKPQNILIDKFGNPVLCDFGMCLPLWDSDDQTRNTATLEQVGSRHYMAPEALGGLRTVANPLALDVYAIGKIAYELAAGRVLPGIEMPKGEYDLASAHVGANDWYLFNAIVRGLVAHDPSIRMIVWQKLSSEIARARAVVDDRSTVDADAFATSVARALEESPEAQQAKREREFYAIRDAYQDRVLKSISDGFLSDPRLQKLRAAPIEGLELEVADISPSGWVNHLPQMPIMSVEEFRDGRSAPSVSARVRIGKTPADDVLPLLATDVVWHRDLRRLKVTFALFVRKYSPTPSGGVVAAPEPSPEIESLDWATLGDETYPAQAHLTAVKMAGRFLDILANILKLGGST